MRALFLVLALVAVALPARAQTRAIIGPFDGGRDGAQARRAVTNALDGVVAVATRDAVAQAAREVHEDPNSQAGILAAARALRVELVVTGSVSGRGSRARTTIIVTSSDGRELSRTVAGPPFGRIGGQAVGDAAITVVQEAQNELARQQQMVATHQGWPTPPAGEEPTPPPAEQHARATGAPPWVRITAGLDIRTHDTNVVLFMGAGTRSYSSGAYPELAATVDIHPFNGLGSAGAGFYLRGDGGVSVGLDSETDPSQPRLATTTWHVSGALGYLGLVADGVVGLGGSVAVGADRFSIEDNPIYPSTTFTFVRAALDARFAIVRDLFVLTLGGGYRAVLGTGDLDSYSYDAAGGPMIGTAFGPSSVFGWDVHAAIGGTLDGGFTWAIRFAFERYEMLFSDPPGQIGEGDTGSDQTIRVGAFMGWSFY